MRNKNNKVLAYSFKLKQQTTVLILFIYQLQISGPASGVVRYQYTRFFPHKGTNFIHNNCKIFDTEYPKLLWDRLPVPNNDISGHWDPRLSKLFRWKNLAVCSRHLPSEKIREGESEAREPLYTG